VKKDFPLSRKHVDSRKEGESREEEGEWGEFEMPWGLIFVEKEGKGGGQKD